MILRTSYLHSPEPPSRTLALQPRTLAICPTIDVTPRLNLANNKRVSLFSPSRDVKQTAGLNAVYRHVGLTRSNFGVLRIAMHENATLEEHALQLRIIERLLSLGQGLRFLFSRCLAFLTFRNLCIAQCALAAK